MENNCPGSILPIPSIVNEMYMYDQMYGYADKFFLNKNVVFYKATTHSTISYQ